MNDNEDEFEYDEEDDVIAPCREIQRMDLAVLGLHLVHGIASAVTSTLGLSLRCVCGHANYKAERRQFHEDAAREIERMTEE